jgi:hypothetical protein
MTVFMVFIVHRMQVHRHIVLQLLRESLLEHDWAAAADAAAVLAASGAMYARRRTMGDDSGAASEKDTVAFMSEQEGLWLALELLLRANPVRVPCPRLVSHDNGHTLSPPLPQLAVVRRVGAGATGGRRTKRYTTERGDRAPAHADEPHAFRLTRAGGDASRAGHLPARAFLNSPSRRCRRLSLLLQSARPVDAFRYPFSAPASAEACRFDSSPLIRVWRWVRA